MLKGTVLEPAKVLAFKIGQFAMFKIHNLKGDTLILFTVPNNQG